MGRSPRRAPWAEIPERYGPSTTCYNRFVRWRRAGVWDRLLVAVSAGFNGELVMIDSTCMRVHQHGATGKSGDLEIMAWDVPGAALQPNSTLSSMLMACRCAAPLRQRLARSGLRTIGADVGGISPPNSSMRWTVATLAIRRVSVAAFLPSASSARR